MISVYKFCECDLVVTNKTLEETIKWYNEEYMEADAVIIPIDKGRIEFEKEHDIVNQ